MVNDVILAKCESIEKCIRSINNYYNNDRNSLQDIKTQDAIIINIERACQCSIDLAMLLVRQFKLGLPKESRDAFDKICEKGIIDKHLNEKLKKMVAFRNIAIHEYKKLDLQIIEHIICVELEKTFKPLIHIILNTNI